MARPVAIGRPVCPHYAPDSNVIHMPALYVVESETILVRRENIALLAKRTALYTEEQLRECLEEVLAQGAKGAYMVVSKYKVRK